jgi:hypothetical protein
MRASDTLQEAIRACPEDDLLTSPQLANLEHLGVRKRRCGLSPEATERLQQRFGTRFSAYAF